MKYGLIWLDLRRALLLILPIKQSREADAFIAEAVAELTLYPDALKTGDVSKKARAAGKMVIDKTAIDSNKDWQTAYKNVVTAVGQVYKKYGLRIDHVEKGEGAREGRIQDHQVSGVHHRRLHASRRKPEILRLPARWLSKMKVSVRATT